MKGEVRNCEWKMYDTTRLTCMADATEQFLIWWFCDAHYKEILERARQATTEEE